MSDPIRQRLEERLATLRREYETGQTQLSAMEARAEEIRSTMLRISGAIQVIEEELGRGDAAAEPEDAARTA